MAQQSSGRTGRRHGRPCAPLLPPWARSQVPSRGHGEESLIKPSHNPSPADKDPWPPSDTLACEGCTYVLVLVAPSQSKPSKVAILVFVFPLFTPSPVPFPSTFSTLLDPPLLRVSSLQYLALPLSFTSLLLHDSPRPGPNLSFHQPDTDPDTVFPLSTTTCRFGFPALRKLTLATA